MIKAAQYIRMSTDRQDLSPAFQKEAIAKYADTKGIELVASYEDLGRSGVRIANRPALKQLLKDVTDKPGFSVILVYDVSRWGRFQDADASAYYDYHCRLNGVSVVYVAETFGEGISPIATLVKSMKRVMAAEYSRDLALKCAAGQERVISMGFQMGYMPCLGFRRESVSADGQRRVVLERGQRKLAATDRIRWVLAPDEEVALVRRIFDLYAHTGCSLRALVKLAQAEGWVSHRDRPLSLPMFSTLLRCEAFIGNFVWGRPRRQTKHHIARMAMCRVEGAVPRIVDDSTWALAQAKSKGVGWVAKRSSEDLLRDLKLALERNPRMTTPELAANGCATKYAYAHCFGSWHAALQATGVDSAQLERNACDRGLERRIASYSYGCGLEDELVRRRVPARFNGRYNVLVLRRWSIRVRLLWPKVGAGGRCLWPVAGHDTMPEVGHVLFVRVEATGSPIDFFVVPFAQIRSGFPRWLAREVPADLRGYWSASRAMLLRRLVRLWRQNAASAAQVEYFSAAALKWHRHILGLTAKQCGALIGVARQSIYLWERGKSWPSPRHKEAITRFERLNKQEARVQLADIARRRSLADYAATSPGAAPQSANVQSLQVHAKRQDQCPAPGDAARADVRRHDCTAEAGAIRHGARRQCGGAMGNDPAEQQDKNPDRQGRAAHVDQQCTHGNDGQLLDLSLSVAGRKTLPDSV